MNFQTLRADYIFHQFSVYLSSFKISHNISPILVLNLFLSVSLFTLLVYIIRRLINIKRSLNELSVLLELTPPASTEKTAYTTQQLFSVIHDLGKQKSFIDKILGKKTIFSFEIVSTQNQGIRYLIRTTTSEVNNIQRNLLSYLPQVKVKTVNEYLPQNIGKINKFQNKVVEFKLKRHFAYPLQRQDTLLGEHDPVAYITGMMTKLSPGELISFQIVLSPTTRKETETLSKMVLNNENVLCYLNKPQVPTFLKLFSVLLTLIAKLITVILNQLGWAIQELMSGGRRAPSYIQNSQNQMQIQQHIKPARVLTTFEQDTVKSIQQKIDQSLFETSIRLLVVVKDKSELKERIKGFSSSLAIFSVPGYQSLNKKYNFPPILIDKIRLLNFKKRLLSLISNQSSSLLSISEISDLYHFPFMRVSQTEDMVKSHSKELPAPLALKQKDNLDVIFAKNTYGGATTMIGLTKEERMRHMYILGATGTGKSTLLLSQIAQDIKNGKGICLIDPHGDLAKAVLNTVPKEREKDVVYINPFDIKNPVAINLLEYTSIHLDGDDVELENDFISESVVSIFRKIFSNEFTSGSAHRIEYVLRNTVQTALTLKERNLFTIYDLLNDPDFRKNALTHVKDDRLLKFWKNELGKAGSFQQVKMTAPITARIGRFLFSPIAKRILDHQKSSVNFDEILDSGKILICNLSKGNLGEDTSQVVGILILAKIQLAILKRARLEAENRKTFFLYVDEFQNFATKSFVDMMAESRKYGLNITIAEQSTSQQNDRNLTNVTLANTGTVICFKTANPEDEDLILPQFKPYIQPGEIGNLPTFHFYMKNSAIDPQEPFSGQTMLVDIKEDKGRMERIIQLSRDKYSVKYIPTKTSTPLVENNSNEEVVVKKTRVQRQTLDSFPEELAA